MVIRSKVEPFHRLQLTKAFYVGGVKTALFFNLLATTTLA